MPPSATIALTPVNSIVVIERKIRSGKWDIFKETSQHRITTSTFKYQEHVRKYAIEITRSRHYLARTHKFDSLLIFQCYNVRVAQIVRVVRVV